MNPFKTPAIIAYLVLSGSICDAQTEKYSTVKIFPPSDKAQRASLIGLLQIDHFYESGGAIITEISGTELSRLRTTSYRYEILIDDVTRKLNDENEKYYRDKAQAISSGQNRMAFEQTGNVINNIIATPSSFVVQPTFGGYYSFAQMEAAMNALVAAYPSIVQKTSLGLSHQGRDIWCMKISDNVNTDETGEPEVLYMGLQHAREAIGGSSMIFFMQYLCEFYATDNRVKDLVDNREVFIIPCMNPDGWEYNRLNGGAGSGWRKNRRNNGGGEWGVDLNRNWGVDWGNCSAPIIGSPLSCGSNDPAADTYYGPSAFSEPETQAIRDFTYSRRLVAMIDQHCYGPYYSLPFGRPSLPSNVMAADDDRFYTYISGSMGNYNGMRSGNSPEALGYEVAGGVKDWMLKGNIGTGTKGKVMGMTGEGGAGGGTGGTYGSFWAPASQIINLCKGMTYQNLQLLYAAGSYVDLQDLNDIAVNTTSGTFGFHVTRVGLEDRPVTVSMIPLENIQTTGSPVTISSLANYYDTYTGTIGYTLKPALTNGQRIRFAWKIETGGYSWYDTVTKFFNPVTMFSDDMEGSNVSTNWAVTGGWNYTAEDAYSGSKSLAESPGGNYTASSTRRATYTGSLDLSDATAAWLSFWVKHRAENFQDKLRLLVSDDGGSTWNAVAGTTTVEEPGTLDGSSINGIPSLTGIKENWTRELFDLGAWLNTPALRLRFEFISDAASSYDFSEDDGFHIDNVKVIKSTVPLVTLPVHFISFTGRLLPDNTVRLDWKAVTDQLHDYFEVERSADGMTFHSLGKGPAAVPYWKIDLLPSVGNNYYRIKQVDKDGTIAYSNIIIVSYSPDVFTVSLYPNPATEVLHVKLNTKVPAKYIVSLTDMTGRKVYEEQVVTNASGGEIHIGLKEKASQVYILIIRNEKNEIIASQKVVKQ
ncbi:MAG: T9SS type A sorting domain-containing protein [Chitinophagaceae bacterium]|nr:T9SS type A sorting domain-containing protein [Chitinophagaceae bacterium]